MIQRLALIVALVSLSAGCLEARGQISHLDLEKTQSILVAMGLRPETNVAATRELVGKLRNSDFVLETIDGSANVDTTDYLYHTRDETKLSCRNNFASYIYECKQKVHEEANLFLDSFRHYIDDAYDRITRHCLEQLSAADWSPMTIDISPRDIDMMTTFVSKCSLPDDPNQLEITSFYIEVADCAQVAATQHKVNTTDIFQAMDRLEEIDANVLCNLGQPRPISKYNDRLRVIHKSSLVKRRLADQHKIDSMNLESFYAVSRQNFVRQMAKLAKQTGPANPDDAVANKERYMKRVEKLCNKERVAALLRLLHLGVENQNWLSTAKQLALVCSDLE